MFEIFQVQHMYHISSAEAATPPVKGRVVARARKLGPNMK